MVDDAPSMPDPVHPELRSAARFLPRRLSVGRRTLPALRVMAALTDLRRPPGGVESLTLPSGVGVRLHRPAGINRATPALLWVHGGGYVIGSAKQDDGLCRRFARTLGITVASVNYRLAPEHPYPAALDDCYDSLIWLASLPGVDTARIAIGGASAGGGLAAALALRARDRESVSPVCQLLVYPMLDDRTGTPVAGDGTHLGWNQASNQFGWASYLGQGDPYVAVPARRDDLWELPSSWIGVGTMDLFYGETLTYAERLTHAGVSCHLEVVPGAFHGFDLIAPRTRVAEAFFDSQCATLRESFGR